MFTFYIFPSILFFWSHNFKYHVYILDSQCVIFAWTFLLNFKTYLKQQLSTSIWVSTGHLQLNTSNTELLIKSTLFITYCSSLSPSNTYSYPSLHHLINGTSIYSVVWAKIFRKSFLAPPFPLSLGTLTYLECTHCVQKPPSPVLSSLSKSPSSCSQATHFFSLSIMTTDLLKKTTEGQFFAHIQTRLLTYRPHYDSLPCSLCSGHIDLLGFAQTSSLFNFYGLSPFVFFHSRFSGLVS